MLKLQEQSVTKFYWENVCHNIEKVGCNFLSSRITKILAFRDLIGTTDPVCNLLSWQFQLTQDYGLKYHALELQTCVEKVQSLYESNSETFENILKFLLNLRNVPKKDENKLVSDKLEIWVNFF